MTGRNQTCPCGSGKKYKKCCDTVGIQAGAEQNTLSVDHEMSRGLSQFNSGDFKGAIRSLEKALALSKDNPKAMHLLGLAQARDGRMENGISSLESAIELDPENTIYWNDYGLISEELGDIGRAISCFEEAHRLGRSDPEPIYNLGRLLVSVNAGKDAIRYLEVLEKTVPGDEEIKELLVLAYVQANKWQEAESLVDKLLGQNPDNKRARFLRAKVLVNTAEFDTAYVELKNIYEQDAETRDAALMNIIELLELNHKLDEAKLWLDKVPSNGPPALKVMVGHTRANILMRDGDYKQALEQLKGVDGRSIPAGLHANTYYLMGQIQDKLGKYSEAFVAYQEANQLRATAVGSSYKDQIVTTKFGEIKDVFQKQKVEYLLRPEIQQGNSTPVPVFILGFMRSGTTLVEQILSSHPDISAGGELQEMEKLEKDISNIVGSKNSYPESMLDIKESEKSAMLSKMRDCYMKGVVKAGIPVEGFRYFTDKEPSNSQYLGLIRTILPEAPIVHVLRHPLDTCLSTYFSRINEEHNYSINLMDTAYYYRNVWDLVKFYKQELDLNYHAIRYEDLVIKPELNIRELLEFLDVPWNEACLNFHQNKRVAHTPSYEQVTRKLYTDSAYRYKNYRKQVQEIVPVLEPVMQEMGYEVE